MIVYRCAKCGETAGAHPEGASQADGRTVLPPDWFTVLIPGADNFDHLCRWCALHISHYVYGEKGLTLGSPCALHLIDHGEAVLVPADRDNDIPEVLGRAEISADDNTYGVLRAADGAVIYLESYATAHPVLGIVGQRGS